MRIKNCRIFKVPPRCAYDVAKHFIIFRDTDFVSDLCKQFWFFVADTLFQKHNAVVGSVALVSPLKLDLLNRECWQTWRDTSRQHQDHEHRLNVVLEIVSAAACRERIA